MLRNINKIKGQVLAANDGEIGRCNDFLIDDRTWVVRYMVADTGKWLPGRKVLISPISLGRPDWDSGILPVMLTKQQIEESPPLDEAAPVSRKYEIEMFDYYKWPYYWEGGARWGPVAYPYDLYKKLRENIKKKGEVPENCNLRSVKEVTGYSIQASDGEIGHVDDFVVDEDSWAIFYLVVKTRNLLPGKNVLVSVNWSDKIDWAKRNVYVTLSIEAVKNSPEYDPEEPLDENYEKLLHSYYGLPFGRGIGTL
jgi:hypothetical protein